MSGAEAVLGAGVAISIAISGFTLWRVESARIRVPRRRQEAPPPTSGALQKVGIVRFNPFHDTGGDYSFAVALLDGTGSGVLLTGLYHREQCRVYAKPVRAWASTYVLTDEEREAIDLARAEEELETAAADRL